MRHELLPRDASACGPRWRRPRSERPCRRAPPQGRRSSLCPRRPIGRPRPPALPSRSSSLMPCNPRRGRASYLHCPPVARTAQRGGALHSSRRGDKNPPSPVVTPPAYDLAHLAERLRCAPRTKLPRRRRHRGRRHRAACARGGRRGRGVSHRAGRARGRSCGRGTWPFRAGAATRATPTRAPTAMRETVEEVGLDLAARRDLSRAPRRRADDPPQAHDVDIRVAPFVFALRPRRAPHTLNHEVADALWTPLAPMARGEISSASTPFAGRTKTTSCRATASTIASCGASRT